MLATNYECGFHRQASLIEFLPKRLVQWLTQDISSYLFSFFLGAITPLSFAPFNVQWTAFSYLIFFSLSLFFYQVIQTCSAKEALYKGWLFGIGLFSVGVSWLYVAIHDFGAAHWSLAGFFTGGFILFMALFYALFAWSLFKLKQSLSILKEGTEFFSQWFVILFYLPILWVLLEWLRSWFMTGFPWLLSGYPIIEMPLSGYAPIIGIYGSSLLVAIISAFLIVRIKPYYSLLAIALIFTGGYCLQSIQWSESQGEPLKVSLIQGNVNQSLKWDRWQLEKTKQLYVALSADQWQESDLIIWPENAIPVFYHTLEKNFYQQLSLKAQKTQTELITGLPVLDDKTEQYYNSLTNLGGEQSFYYKTHLVPFGEYVPLASLIRGLIQFFNIPMSGFSVGDSDQSPILIKGHKVVVTLCYEDVFPQDMMQNIPESRFMINLSNNGWYGDSFAPHQHLEMARMRALETSRELIRSTTSGISALVDSKGVVQSKGPQFKQAVINGTIQPRTGTTPYVFWGNYPIIALFLIALLVLWFQIQKNNSDDL